MSQAAIPFQHPLQRCAAAVAAAVGEAAESSPIYLSTEAKAEVLVSLSRAIARLEGLRLAVVAAAGDVAETDGARSAGAWLAHRARLERPEGRRLQALAEALDERYPVLAGALLAGEVSRPQAEVIATALDQLPADLERGLRGEAERVDHAGDLVTVGEDGGDLQVAVHEHRSARRERSLGSPALSQSVPG